VTPDRVRLAPGASQRVDVNFCAPSHAAFDAFVEGEQALCTDASAVTLRLLDKPDGSGKEALLQGSFHPFASGPPAPILPLRVALSAQCQPAQLTLDDADSCSWTAHSTHPKSHVSFCRTATLTNTSRSALTFTLATKGPFSIAGAECSVAQTPDRFCGSACFSSSIGASTGAAQPEFCLPPDESVDVTIWLMLGKHMVLEDHSLSGALAVAFINGEMQTFPLTSRVLHPALEAQHLDGSAADVVTFGRVHARARKTVTIRLENPTDVDAAWNVETAGEGSSDGATSVAKVGAFKVAPAVGMLPGRRLGMPQQARVQVTFAPTGQQELREVLRFRLKGGPERSVTVVGEGSFDERDEPLSHLSTLYQ
jgi:hypothetical protein